MAMRIVGRVLKRWAESRRASLGRWRRSALGLAVGAVSLSACVGADDGRSGAPGDDPARSPTPTGSARIVSLVPSLTEIVIALGAVDHLVARTDYDTDPSVVDLPSVGGGLDPNLEALVGLRAELVLMPGVQDTPALVDRLAGLGIAAMVLETETVDDLHSAVLEIGQRLGRSTQADSLNASIRAGLDEVRARVADRPAVSVMYVVWGDPPMTAGPGTFVDEVIQIAGGRNVFDDAPIQWPTVGFETIVDRSPEVIVWPRGEVGGTDLDEIAQRPGWRDVAAIRAGRVVFVDADLFNRPGPGVVQAARELARRLHPDAF